jgi:hypothetical protein
MAATDLFLAGVLAIRAVQPPAAWDPQPSTPAVVVERERVEVDDHRQTVRGRVAGLTADLLVVDTHDGRVTLPVASIRRINRVGDSLANGAAIGAGIGGGASLALMAKLCANTGCADTSANLDPRITLLGTLMGAGLGALVDAAVESRTAVYQSGAGQTPVLSSRHQASGRAGNDVMVFGRFGWARVTDDEGWLGNGATFGTGVIIPVGQRVGLQIAYDRHTRQRDLADGGGFFGTEQILTGKALFFFRATEAVRPYASIGLGVIDSTRRSEFPTFTFTPDQLRPTAGPPEILRYQTRDAALGFGVGVSGRITRRLSVLGDLTLDIGGGEVLGSTRVTVGAGWHF